MPAKDGTARRRGGPPSAGPTSSCTPSTSRSTSPAESDMSDAQIDAIITKLPHWVDQLGGIRNLVIGGLLVSSLCSRFGPMVAPV